jgi:hypothetical protein
MASEDAVGTLILFGWKRTEAPEFPGVMDSKLEEVGEELEPEGRGGAATEDS